MAKIEGIEFRLFKDYDHDRDHKIQNLTIDGKIEYFKQRVLMVLIRPMARIFSDRAVIQKLDGNGKDIRTFLLCSMTIILCSIEALGSFLNGDAESKKDNLKDFISKYMSKKYSRTVNNISILDRLYHDFRCGLAHGILVEKGGFEFLDNRPYIVKPYGLMIDPNIFYGSFRRGFFKYMKQLKTDAGLRRNFLNRFKSTYLI